MRCSALALALVALTATTPVSQAAFPGQNGKIVYESNEGAPPNPPSLWPYYEIYTINPDGTGRQQLTSNSTFDGDAAWSPDGSKIVYVADGIISIMNSDGTDQTSLGVGGLNPAWSPDGSEIAFVRFGGEYNSDIYVMNADGSGQTPLTNDGSSEEYGPGWSPDGGRIAWQRIRFYYDVNEETYVPEPPEVVSIDADGTDQQTLWTGNSPAYAADVEPAWSPDGQRIAFGGYDSEGIALINANGTGLTVINTAESGEGHPAWSPDGTKIAFDAYSGARGGVYTMNLDGSGVVNVNNTPGVDEWRPDWQPLPDNTTDSHIRPKSATPFRVPLVPAYQPCTTSHLNRTHGPPLAFGSCNPPQPGSSYLTVGVGDGSPALARSTGSVRMDVKLGAPGAPEDSDVNIRFSLTNVMRASDLSEYTGELRSELTVRRTDRDGLGFTPHSTSMDFPFGFTVPCNPTPGSSLDASSCVSFTSVNAVVPGVVKDTNRAVWALDALRVYDGGPDEDADTTGGNSLFAVQGLFVP